MNPKLPSRKKLVPTRKRFEVIFSRASACFLRFLDPIIFYLPSELPDAIFGDAEAEPQIVADDSVGVTVPGSSPKKKRKRRPRTELTDVQKEALLAVEHEGSFEAAGNSIGKSGEAVRRAVLRADSIMRDARSVQAKQTLPKDRRGQDSVPYAE